MGLRLSLIAILCLFLVKTDVVQAQASSYSAATIYPIEFENDNLQGQEIGTGLGGTTYQLSGVVSGLWVPYTMTLVENESQVSEVAVVNASGTTLFAMLDCGISTDSNSAEATCTEVIIIGSSASTQVAAGLVTPVVIAVDIASLDPNFTGTAQPPTTPGATGSFLGPTITISSNPTVTVTQTSTVIASGAMPRPDATTMRFALFAWFVAGVTAAASGLTLVF